MKTRLLHYLELVTTNFWMIPLFSLVVAAALAVLAFQVDRALLAHDLTPPESFLYFKNAEVLRSLLGVSASSVLGVAGVSFSITIAALTLASQQFGPRLLRNFMLDRFNQTVLGIFMGTFLYCLLTMQLTNHMETDGITPFASTTGLFVLDSVSLLALVFFIHHISMVIQADTVVTNVNAELQSKIAQLFPEGDEESDAPIKLQVPDDLDERLERTGVAVPAAQSGYVQAIDTEGAIALATEHEIFLELRARAGDFVIEGTEIARYLGSPEAEADALADKINSRFILGSVSTAEQDPEFAIRQLVEVAVRALSPGINDPFTAIACIDKLGETVAYLMDRRFPPEHYADEAGNLRLRLKPLTFNGMVEAAFNQIRQNGEKDVAVTIRLLRTLAQLAERVRTPEQVEALRRQAEAMDSAAQASQRSDKDAKDIEECLHLVYSRLDAFRGGAPMAPASEPPA